MTRMDQDEPSSTFSGLSGFAPVDERREVRPRHGAVRWAFWALAGVPLVALAFLLTGGVGGGLLLGGLAIAGLKMAARRADAADQIARGLDDERRKQEEDVILAQRLAEARKRMNGESGSL